MAARSLSDTSIVTQRDDGNGDPRRASTGFATSSISAPGIAYRFLDLLDAHPGDRVLEIGTGTGYTAAVLAARLGSDNVTSVELDAQVAEQAAVNLDAAGFSPRLVVGDGADGHRDGAPYVRIHATCAVAEVPYSWVAQTRPGGVIVVPWQPHRGYGLITRLTIGEHDGEPAAHGSFHGPCGYMMLRASCRCGLETPSPRRGPGEQNPTGPTRHRAGRGRCPARRDRPCSRAGVAARAPRRRFVLAPAVRDRRPGRLLGRLRLRAR